MIRHQPPPAPGAAARAGKKRLHGDARPDGGRRRRHRRRGLGSQPDRRQQARNDFIKRENDKLDAQIREIAKLREEIDSLKARQLAVENLQRDRTLPVYVMDELVRQTPEGMYFRRSGRRTGRSRAAARRSRTNASRTCCAAWPTTPWLERPELVEIKAVTPASPTKARKRAGLRVLAERDDQGGGRAHEGRARPAAERRPPVGRRPGRDQASGQRPRRRPRPSHRPRRRPRAERDSGEIADNRLRWQQARSARSSAA